MHALYLPQRPLQLIAAFAAHEAAVALTSRVSPFDLDQIADVRARREVLSAAPPDLEAAASVPEALWPPVIASASVPPPHGRLTRLAVLRRGDTTKVLLGFSSPRTLNRLACLDASSYPPRFVPLADNKVLHEALQAILGTAYVQGELCYAPVPAAWGLGGNMWLVLAHACDRETRRSGFLFGRHTLHWLDADRMVVTRSVNLPDLNVLRFAAVSPQLALCASDPDHFSLVVDGLDNSAHALRFCMHSGRPRAALCYTAPPPNPGDLSPMHFVAPCKLPLSRDRWLVIPQDGRPPCVMCAQPCQEEPPLALRAVEWQPADDDDEDETQPAPAPAAADPTLLLEDPFGFWSSMPGVRFQALPLRDVATARTLIFLSRGPQYALAALDEPGPAASFAPLGGDPASFAPLGGDPASFAPLGGDPSTASPAPRLTLLDLVDHGRSSHTLTSLRPVSEDEIYATYCGAGETDVIGARNGRLELRTAAGRAVAHGLRPDPGVAVVLAQIARQKEARFAAHGAALAALAGAAGL